MFLLSNEVINMRLKLTCRFFFSLDVYEFYVLQLETQGSIRLSTGYLRKKSLKSCIICNDNTITRVFLHVYFPCGCTLNTRNKLSLHKYDRDLSHVTDNDNVMFHIGDKYSTQLVSNKKKKKKKCGTHLGQLYPCGHS